MTSKRARAILLLVVFSVLILTMPAERMYGDPVFPQEAAKALVLHGRLHVTAPERELRAAGGNFVHNPQTDRWYSKWGVLNTLLFSVPTAAYALLRGGSLPDDRVFLLCLNAFYILVAALVALLLFGLLEPFCSAPAIRLLYSLAILFASFVWYYLRAQSIDLFHLLLFLLYLRLLHAWRARPSIPLLVGAAFFLGCCALAKSGFLLFFVPFLLVVYLALPRDARDLGSAVRAVAPPLGLLALFVGALLAVNQHKFGDWLAFGYHQNAEIQTLPLLDRNPLSSLHATLFDLQRGLFVHLPMALLSALCFRAFWQRFPWHALSLLAHVVPQVLLIILVAPLWHGEWCYGPRLLLFLAPMIALPGALFFNRAVQGSKRPWIRTASLGAAAAFSLLYQLKVNLMPFHHFYELNAVFAAYQDPRYSYRINQFLMKAHCGEIYDSALALAQGGYSHKAFNLIRLHRPGLHERLVAELARRDRGVNLLLFR